MVALPKTDMAATSGDPASQLVGSAFDDAPGDHVTLAWLLKGLGHRTFGMTMLLLDFNDNDRGGRGEW